MPSKNVEYAFRTYCTNVWPFSLHGSSSSSFLGGIWGQVSQPSFTYFLQSFLDKCARRLGKKEGSNQTALTEYFSRDKKISSLFLPGTLRQLQKFLLIHLTTIKINQNDISLATFLTIHYAALSKGGCSIVVSHFRYLHLTIFWKMRLFVRFSNTVCSTKKKMCFVFWYFPS